MPSLPTPARDPLREPSPRRLPLDTPLRGEILAAHNAALACGAPMYRDPATGYQVMTSAALLGRGMCCGCGCRHCPYVR